MFRAKLLVPVLLAFAGATLTACVDDSQAPTVPPVNASVANDDQNFPDNEPAGMTQRVFVNGSTKEWTDLPVVGPEWNASNRIVVVSDAASKYGSVVEKRFFVGDGSGWHGHRSRGKFGARKELYFRLVFKLSDNWQWHKAGGKWFYFGAEQIPSGKTQWPWVVDWEANGQLAFLPTEGFTKGGTAHPGGRLVAEGVPPISRGVYHTIEVHFGASTVGANGFLRMWQDGVKVQTYRNKASGVTGISVDSGVEWDFTKTVSDKRANGVQAPMFWGGQGDTKQVNDYVRISELYISGKN